MSTSSQVEAIFLAALDQPTAAGRAAYLDQACGEDAELRRRVDRLLKAYPGAANFLARPAVERLEVGPMDETEATLGLTPTSPSDKSAETIETLSDRRGGEDGDALSILEPSARPDSLGRLAHYEVLEVLGKGSFGTVVKALDGKLNRFVAIKLMTPILALTSPPRKRFVREARSAAAVRHHNVVTIHAVEDQPSPYLVMEYIAGRTLQQKLDSTGPLEVAEVIRIGLQIASGLAAAHAIGLIHRDIKPSNILLEGELEHIKITDFGLARAADDASISQSGLIAGTPMYMAPEQAMGEAVDHRADLFSLGSVLYAVCTGRPPFRAANTLAVLKRVTEDTPRPIREIMPEVPDWLSDLINRLHAKNPAERIGSAKEVAQMLERRPADIPKQESVATPPVDKTSLAGAIENPQPVRQRPMIRRPFGMVAGAVLFVLIGGLGFSEATGVTDFRGTVIRLFSPDGTLVVEVDDPGVSVRIDGSDMVITGAGAREIRLKPGSYTVQARKGGKLVDQELVTVTRNGRKVVRISREATPSDTKTVKETTDSSNWEQSVVAMPAVEQVKAVANRLKELNPGFDGAVEPTIENGVVTGLRFSSEQVTDLAPVRAIKQLTVLRCRGTSEHHSRIKDLSPLKGMALSVLDLTFTEVVDLSPLRGTALREIELWGVFELVDLSPLEGMPLQKFIYWGNNVKDLSPLKGMPLRDVCAMSPFINDLVPFQDMKLTALDIRGTSVASLSPLKGMPLSRLWIRSDHLSDISPLKGMPLRDLNLTTPGVSDLSPLHGMPLEHLDIAMTKATDVSPLKGLPLEDLKLNPRNITQGIDMLREMKSLKIIGTSWDKAWPVAEFWERYSTGKFLR